MSHAQIFVKVADGSSLTIRQFCKKMYTTTVATTRSSLRVCRHDLLYVCRHDSLKFIGKRPGEVATYITRTSVKVHLEKNVCHLSYTSVRSCHTFFSICAFKAVLRQYMWRPLPAL